MSDLLDIAARIAGWASDGEEVEAYVARASDTAVRVYDATSSRSRCRHGGRGHPLIAGGARLRLRRSLDTR